MTFKVSSRAEQSKHQSTALYKEWNVNKINNGTNLELFCKVLDENVVCCVFSFYLSSNKRARVKTNFAAGSLA